MARDLVARAMAARANMRRTEPPTSGSWRTGDVVYNAAPAPGDYVGWVCVEGGTPGVWHGFGQVAGEPTGPLPEIEAVRWTWVGGVTDTEAVITHTLLEDADDVRVVYSTDPTLAGAQRTEAKATASKTVKHTLTGLQPNTRYYWALETGGGRDTRYMGQFRTFPPAGEPANFTIAFASCAQSGSNHPVFDELRELDPAVFIHMGDFHYDDGNYSGTSPQQYRDSFDAVFAQPRPHQFYRSVPIAYVWDDHDYGQNDGNKSNPRRASARQVYRERVPHYPLPAGDGDAPVHQSFVIGRVRFVLTDLMSTRDPVTDTDGPNKRMIGLEANQFEWFKQQLLSPEPLIVWMSTKPWIGDSSGTDHWGRYATQRQEIADFIKANNLAHKVIIISGDMHAIAYDDGSNSDYATGGGAPLRVFQAAALDQTTNFKGGPYASGQEPAGGSNSGQYGKFDIVDDGQTITVTFTGRRHSTNQDIFTYEFTVPRQKPDDPDDDLPNLLTASEAYDMSAEWSTWHASITPVAWPAPFDVHGGHRITVTEVDPEDGAGGGETATDAAIPGRTYRYSIYVRGTVTGTWMLQLSTGGSTWWQHVSYATIPPGNYPEPTKFSVEHTYSPDLPAGERPDVAVVHNPAQVGDSIEVGYAKLVLLPES